MHVSASLCAIGLAMLVGAAAPAFASPFSAMYVFGDSGSDVGNVFISSAESEPAAPYFDGRYSNGPIVVDDLANTFGLAPLVPAVMAFSEPEPPPAGESIDYAWGGATTGSEGPCCSAQVPVPTVLQQVARFSLMQGGIAPSTGLYVVEIGTNDIEQAITSILGGSMTVTAANTLLAAAAQDTAGAMNTLASEGAKAFLVVSVSDLGKKPSLNGNATSAALGSQLALSYNTELLADLDALIPNDGISLHFLDTFSLIDAWVDDPAAFGFTNVTDACYVGPYTGGGTVCPDPNSFLYWDQQHLTSYADQRIAAAALNEVPEPEMQAGFLAAGLLLIVGRSRKVKRWLRRS
jgi:phospholipase/lecithinase/hemolysin